ncbi:hypothetical protein Tco_0627509 [Tanacetum coccineum]|uniref:Reverse transcriptase zinc-binding domain-containing protein n=1 Tax=Tanacetum coccineum TaxID=301880 RepID=A0ABQ4WMR6_9ASTR
MRPNLTARGVDIPSLTCLFCESDFEDIGYVMVKCLKVSVVWRKVWSWWNLPPPTSFPSFSSIDVAKGNFPDRGCPSIEKVMNGDFQISLWAIWSWKNRIIHATGTDIESAKNEDIFPRIQRIAKLWISARICSKLKTDWVCWIAMPWELFS